MKTEKGGNGESVPDASGCTTEPTRNRERIMRLALEMILAQCKCFTEGRAYIVDPIRRTAEQALRECGK